MKKLKIGIICPYDITAGGGVQEQVLALNKAYNSLGAESYIITPRPKGYIYDEPGIIFLGSSRPLKSMHTYTHVSVSIDTDKIDEILREYQFDILHFHEPWVPMMSRQVLLRSQAINFATFHAALPDLAMAKTIERVFKPYMTTIIKYLDVLTAVSHTASSAARSLTERNILILPNGLDVKKFTPTKELERKKQIFYVGRLERRKGLQYLLQAFAKLQHELPEYELLIAGTGPDEDKLKAYVSDNSIKNVHFLGRITDEEKIEYLHTSQLFCSPAMYGESFGIVLLEAMAAGCPVIAGANPGYSDVLTDDGRLSLIDAKDTDEFARRMALIINSHGYQQVWNKWAQHKVVQYDFTAIAKNYLKLYTAAYQKKHGEQEPIDNWFYLGRHARQTSGCTKLHLNYW
jgi:phosphatidyl-myo-inositol alpha-mannosyltransferase